MIYKCENCDKVYKKKKYLQEHSKLEHSRLESVQCEKCDKYFPNKHSLKNIFIVFIHLNYTLVHFVGQVLRQV